MTEPLPIADRPVSPDGPRRPELIVFDVNETLSDMSPMAQRFADVGGAEPPGEDLVRRPAA